MPDVNAVLRHFKNAFDWTEAKNSGRIIPRAGVDEVYDTASGVVTDIELNLTKHLKEQRELIGDSSINYVSIGKDSYLHEVPESLCGSLPSDYELQSSKKGFSRYWTPTTLLRQVCLAVILAQVGADVPAESFKMSPVDRIFVRMGAKDHIMAGQSTFLTELLETASMLSSATRSSLVALDELGRGTATLDGQASVA